MTEDVEPPKRHAWHYPGTWIRQEKFWFDMFTRSTSALIAALIILITARLAGYFSAVKWSVVFMAVFTSSATIVVLGIVVVATASIVTFRHRRMSTKMAEKMMGDFNNMKPEEAMKLFTFLRNSAASMETQSPRKDSPSEEVPIPN